MASAARARPRRGRRIDGAAYLFIAPTVLLVGLFVLLPLGRVFWYSLTKYEGLGSPSYVGLENFRYLLEWDDFARIVGNNVLLVLGLAVWVVLPFLVALVVFGLPRADLIRTILFLPALLPPVIVGGVFRLLLADEGPVNGALRTVGLGALAPAWLTDETAVLPSVVLMIGWAVLGSGVLFYSAGLAAISTSYIEAAVVDGARWHQLVWHIYRPALRPVTQFWTTLLTVATVTSFFPWIFGLTQGGPGIASTTLDYQVYRTGLVAGKWGLASSIAVVGVLLIAVLLLVQLAASRLRRSGEWT